MGGEVRPPTGVPGLPDELRAQAQAWAERTAQAQGLPARVAEHDVLRSVATLLGMRAGSVMPDRLKARLVESVQPASAGADDDMLQ